MKIEGMVKLEPIQKSRLYRYHNGNEIVLRGCTHFKNEKHHQLVLFENGAKVAYVDNKKILAIIIEADGLEV